MKQYLIAPSILSADFARLGEDTAKALAAGADVVHFDVMDNHYVPNLTIGPMVLKSLRNYGITAPIDVHLMVKPVDRIVPDFAAAGASIITFHPEASEHVDRTLQLIKENGCKAGLVFNPATPLSYLDYVMDKLDVILLMSVNPGFGGQSFIPQTLDKLREKSLSGRIVVFSVSNHEEDVVTALKRGADGYLLKDMEPEDLLKALHQAAAGEMVLSEALTPVLAASLRANRATTERDVNQLTPRERDILKLIAQGLPNKMIARRLDITESTVKVHVKHMLKKMKLKSRVEAAVWVHQERIF